MRKWLLMINYCYNVKLPCSLVSIILNFLDLSELGPELPVHCHGLYTAQVQIICNIAINILWNLWCSRVHFISHGKRKRKIKCSWLVQDGTKFTFPLRRLITNCLGTLRPCWLQQ